MDKNLTHKNDNFSPYNERKKVKIKFAKNSQNGIL